MKRSLIILAGALALGTVIFAGSFLASQRVTSACCARPADNLDWLRMEFHLSDKEMVRVRELHNAYLPKCAALCEKITEKKRELQSVLGAGTNLTNEARMKLDEIAALRAQCQAQMLEHFASVSAALPSEQGKRYLAEMKKLTLESHEQTEESMSDDTAHEHHH